MLAGLFWRRGWDGECGGACGGGKERAVEEPLGGMPSTSSLAFARAVVASWGREVRIRDAERGRGRVSGVGSSGMGGEREGVGESGMVGCGWIWWKCRRVR